MSFIDTIPSDSLKLLLHGKRCEYNESRRKFIAKAQQYNRQSVASSYCKEEELMELLTDCQKKEANVYGCS